MGKNNNVYTVYYLCLINWTKILSDIELEEFNIKISSTDKSGNDLQEPNGDWIRRKLNFEDENDLKEILCNSTIGFYHSRIIFTFKVKGVPRNVTKIRKIRIRLEKRIKRFFQEEGIIQKVEDINSRPMNNDDNNKPKNNRPSEPVQIEGRIGPSIFIYPIFELKKCDEFWKSERSIPYSLPTTCFFTKLGDKSWNNVEMRISGAKVITQKMSDWFFETLVNIIFHEGLYPQSRDKDLKLNNKEIKVFGSLENRLETFAGRLMTIFHQYSINRFNKNLQIIAVVATVVGLLLATIFTIINLIIQALSA